MNHILFVLSKVLFLEQDDMSQFDRITKKMILQSDVALTRKASLQKIPVQLLCNHDSL